MFAPYIYLDPEAEQYFSPQTIEWFRKNRYSEPAPYFCEDQELLLRTYSVSHFAAVDGYEVSFIRAPIFTEIGAGVEILAEQDGRPVWVRKGNAMASAFHPELTLDFPSPMHKIFIDLVR